MKKKVVILVLFAAIACLPIRLLSQTETDNDTLTAEDFPDEVIINGKRYKAVDDTPKDISKKTKLQKPIDSTFVVDNNKFQYYNNWLCVGGGVQQNLTYKRDLGFVGAVDFNFHIKRNYFQAGALLSGSSFARYNNYQIRLGYVRRYEDRDFHFAAAMGATYSTGFQIEPVDSVTNITRYYSQPGLFLQGEVVKKITYDVGIGACLFVDWNKEQSIAGLRFVLYFSGAYTGKKYKTYNNY